MQDNRFLILLSSHSYPFNLIHLKSNISQTTIKYILCMHENVLRTLSICASQIHHIFNPGWRLCLLLNGVPTYQYWLNFMTYVHYMFNCIPDVYNATYSIKDSFNDHGLHMIYRLHYHIVSICSLYNTTAGNWNYLFNCGSSWSTYDIFIFIWHT